MSPDIQATRLAELTAHERAWLADFRCDRARCAVPAEVTGGANAVLKRMRRFDREYALLNTLFALLEPFYYTRHVRRDIAQSMLQSDGSSVPLTVQAGGSATVSGSEFQTTAGDDITAVSVEDGCVLWAEALSWLEGLLESGRIQRLRGYLAVNESRAAVCGHAAMIMADTSLVHVVHGVRGEPLQSG